MAKVFRDYEEISESMMEGFTVTKVSTGINAEGSGRYRYIHFPNMDDFEISMQECLCDGEDYEEEQ